MSRSHRLSDDEGTDPGVSGNQPAGGTRSSLWPLIRFRAVALFLSSPPPTEWDRSAAVSHRGGGAAIHHYY